MWKLSKVERKIFNKVLEDALKENNELKIGILNKKIKLSNGKEGLTINNTLKVRFKSIFLKKIFYYKTLE